MKKLIATIAFLALIGFACNRPSKEDTAQLLIKETLSNNMRHPDSYESVSFGTLDSLYSCVEDDSVYVAFEGRLISLGAQKQKVEEDLVRNRKSKENLSQMSFFATVNTPYLDQERRELNKLLKVCDSQIASLHQRVDSIRVSFKPAFMGYAMTHRFKYLSKAGVAMENTTVFYLDTNVNNVVVFKTHEGVLFEYDSTTQKYEPKCFSSVKEKGPDFIAL